MAESWKITVYSYWNSSCSHRVRIALNLKGLDFQYRAVNLFKGEQLDPEFDKLNPIKSVPVLVDGDIILTDSFAILLYLDEKHPQHPLLPNDLKKKALNLQIASIIGSSIQPHQNIYILNFSNEKLKWIQNYINKGFAAIEKLLKDVAGKYATGDEVQLADLYLAPQIYSAISRFEIDMSLYPTLARLNEAYNEHPAFRAAHPLQQPDAPPQA